MFEAQAGTALDPDTAAMLAPMVEKAALTWAIDEAWGLIALLTLAALVCVAFVRRPAAAPAT